MRFEGKVYRPWIEADSLLVQTTLGCSHNKCTFCDMFREKKFGVRKIESILEDIEEARRIYGDVRSIFLVDGNVLALNTDFLLQVLEKVRTTFPECEKVSMYAGLNDLRRKSIDELLELKLAGLTKVYTGLETGHRATLELIQKDMTPEQAVEGMYKARSAGIDVLVSIIFGIGGRECSKEQIIETTRLLNILQPDELAPMALTIQPGTVLAKQIDAGDFIQATPIQILKEEKYLLENLADFQFYYWGDHSNNIVPQRGKMPESRKSFLERIEYAIAFNPVTKQEILLGRPW